MERSDCLHGIAIVGRSARFPGCRTLDAFWEMLHDGREAISFFSGPAPPGAPAGADYVPARGVVDDIELFDAAFFGYTPRVAALIDPQQRLFLECASDALETAGYDPDRFAGSIGVFAGAGRNNYLLLNLLSHPGILRELGGHQVATANDGAFLTTRVSYKLNLRGPSVTVQTACSTSLVAVHLACQSLLNGECDLALAGGVSVALPQRMGYFHQEGGIFSADGHCRAFDAMASGTVSGSGVGVVVLRRLQDAVAAGDVVYAVIRGSAVNNDGSQKMGFTAPSSEGQAAVIAEALSVAGIDPQAVSYIEAHGTGTVLGDPIEMAALHEVFSALPPGRRCGVGSVKTNIGHLDEASGLAGLLKSVLMLEHRQLVPSLHFAQPNPRIGFENGPFYVCRETAAWESDGARRRAGVSSFGLGGTNAHVILEEAPAAAPRPPAQEWQLLAISARTANALAGTTANLADFLGRNLATRLDDVAFTLQVGRREFAHRRFAVCRDPKDAVEILRGSAKARAESTICDGERRSVAFLFPGQGTQRVGMGSDLYGAGGTFRAVIDDCCERLLPQLGIDLRHVLYPRDGEEAQAAARLASTAIAQPALFVTELALARHFMDLGIQPHALLGHSFGEYVAACLAEVFDLDDALGLVALRGELMEELPQGAMLAVPLAAAQVEELLSERLALSAINAAERCVVAGPVAEIEELAARLAARRVACRRLPGSHAFHSPLVAPIEGRFGERLRRIALRPPRIPYLSNVTGRSILPQEATDPQYWVRHLRATVQFEAGLRELLSDPSAVLLEVGPGGELAALVARALPPGSPRRAITSLGGGRASQPERAELLKALGRLWLSGISPDWRRLDRDAQRRRAVLPTYPFERERHWIDPATEPAAATAVDFERREAPGDVEAAPAAPEQGSGDRRRQRILQRVAELIGRLFGLRPADLDVQTSFIDLGADSLLLLQAKEAIQREFAVPLSFFELLEDCPNLAALAAYLDARLPADAAPPVAVPPLAAAPPPPPAGAVLLPVPDGFGQELRQLLARQVELNTALLRLLLEGVAAAPAQAATAAPRPALESAAAASAPAAPAAAFPFGSQAPAAPLRLTDRQRRHLEALIARHTARTRESKRRTELHRFQLADNRSSVGFRLAWKELVYPLIGERSAGSRLWDVDGNEYVDLTMGFGVNLFGHNPPFVRDALYAQLEKGVQVGPQSELAGEVASLICELTGMARVTFCNSGTEAVMTAMRLARAVTGRNLIAFFAGSYHGTFDGTLFNPPPEEGEDPRPVPRAPGVPPGMGSDVVVLDYATPRSLEILARRGAELAAVLVEPVQSRRPDLQPREYLHELRRLTERAGAALIFDETISGFRPHPAGAQGWFDVRADIATYGKVVGGGMPIGVVTGSSRFMDAIDGGTWRFGDRSAPESIKTFFAGTFCKHPLAMAASRAILRELKTAGPEFQRRLNRRTAELLAELEGVFARTGAPIRMVSFGSQFMFSFSAARFSDLFFYELLDRGIYVWEGRTCFLSTAHTEADLRHLVRAVQESVIALQQGEFFSVPASGPQTPALDRAPPAGASALRAASEAQRQLWIETQLGEDALCAYNESLSLRLDGPLATEALRQALQDIVDRHAALRSSFAPDGESLRIAPALRIDLPAVDFAGLEGGWEEGLAAWRRAQERAPFDLVAGPLFRFGLARLAAGSYLLVVTVHHLIVDAWSLGLILQELILGYGARSQGRIPEPPAAGRPEDTAASDRVGMDVESESRAREYWMEQIGGGLPALDLPTDSTRPKVRTYRGARVPGELDAALFTAVKAFSGRQRSTPFVTLLAAFQVLLHRLSGQADLAVGISAAGQAANSELAQRVGFEVNLLPLRSRVAPGLRFIDHLAASRRSFVQALEHQTFPVGRLLRELQTATDFSRPSLVAAELNLEWALPAAEASRLAGCGDLRVQPVPAATEAAKFDLELDCVERAGKLTMACVFNLDLFRPATVRRWLEHYAVLLRAAVETPEMPALELPLLSAAERHQIVLEWNDTARSWSPEPGVWERIERQMARAPQAVAMGCGGAELPYAELGRRVDRLAGHLQQAGAGPEVVVALLAERGLDFGCAVLGILASGGVYLPLDPRHPTLRLEQALAVGRAPLLLVAKELLPRACELSAAWPAARRPRMLALDELLATAGPPRKPAALRGLAYALFTSGSTGVPKAALVEPRGLLNHLLAKIEGLALGPGDCVAQNAAASFDVSIWQLFAALLVGGRTEILPDDVARDPVRLLEEVAARGVTVLELVPSQLATLLEEMEVSAAEGPALPALRCLIATGETLPADLCRRWLALHPTVPLLNAYGPTECSDDVTHQWVPAAPQTDLGIPLGRPLANLRLQVLDRHLDPVPIGVAGELCVGGIGVGRGYLDESGRTALAFRPDNVAPLFAEPGARIYRTGDLGRWLPDGRLEYLGRLDLQVKVRGARVELEEIEAVLLQNPAVRQAALVAWGGGLVAYVVTRDEAVTSPEALRAELQRRLPEAMVPAHFVTLAALPLGPGGKIDRRALPPPALTPVDTDPAAAPPRGALEQGIAEVWAEVLGMAVGVQSDFFALGGDSLLATRVLTRLRRLFRVELTLRSLFEQPTVRRLAASIDRLLRSGMAIAPLPPLRRAARGGQLPLSFAQQRLWFVDQLAPGSPTYNIPAAFVIQGALDAAALERCLSEIVSRHEVLRTSYAALDGRPAQRIHTPAPLALPRIDLAGLAAPSRTVEMERLLAAESLRAFDLARSPLIRALLLLVGADEHALCVTLHHIASDGWSLEVLLRECGALYRAFSDGLPSPLAKLPMQYADFACWQREWLAGETLAAEVEHWRARLAGLPPLLALPTDRPRPPVQTHRGALRSRTVSAPAWSHLQALARREGVSTFMLLVAAFEVLLHRYSGQADFGFGTPVAGRDQLETEGLIGFFVNTLVLRARIASGVSLRQLLSEVREEVLTAHLHQALPFEKLVEELAPERSLSHTPLFQVLFQLDRGAVRGLEVAGLSFRASPLELTTAKFDLHLTAVDGRQGLTAILAFATGLFDAATAERILGAWVELLGQLAANPEIAVGELELLSTAERLQLLAEWGWNGGAPLPVRCLHERFAEQVVRTPNAIALVSEDRRLTYRELDAAAEHLAGRLDELGVVAETPVALCCGRTLELVIAILGVLKAGGCYLPLDPLYPRERLALLLEDAGARVIVSQADLVTALPAVAATILALDAPAALPRQPLAPHRRRSHAVPENAAYIIYTSGSTGRPKGVVVSHAQVSRLLDATAEWFAFDERDVWTLFHSYAFDFSVWEIWGALCNGGRLVVVPYGTSRDPDAFHELLCREGVTVLNQTPSAFYQLIAADERRPEAASQLALRFVILSGEALELESMAPWFGRHGDAHPRLINMYGITETTVFVTYRPVGIDDLYRGSTIGVPIPDLELYVLDAAERLQPLGTPGEIYVGGQGLARGYLGRPDLTAERFVPDPLSGRPGDRLYRSGDLACYRPGRDLEYLGRIDTQVKIRGFRVELGEIESVLAAHPAVETALVLAREDAPGQKRLVAYVVYDDARATPGDLRGYLGQRLPQHMVPSAIVPLAAMPLTANGKVDRAALPRPGEQATEGWVSAPEAQTAQTLAILWAEALSLEAVGEDGHFFELGGHSLLAIEMVARIREVFGLELPLRCFFETPRLRDLAAQIEAIALGGTVGAEAAMAKGEREAEIPLSFGQQRLWFMDRLHPGDAAYNLPLRLRLTGPLDRAALGAALAEVVRRHETLRTAYVERGGRPVQVVLPSAGPALPLVDLGALPPARSREEGEGRARILQACPMDLARGRVLAALLLLTRPGEHELLLVVHHIACDGPSLGLLAGELVALYRAALRRSPSPLAEPGSQYADFACWQRRWLQGARLDEQLAYWCGRLRGAPPLLELAADRPRPPVQSTRGASVNLPLPPALAAAVQALARKERATPFMAFLAAYAVLLHRCSGQRDIVMGSPVSYRHLPEVRGLIGFLVNTLVLRIDLGGNPSYRELLGRVREVVLGAFSHRDLPFEKIVEALQVERHRSYSPLFQVGFTFVQEREPEPLSDLGVEVTALEVETSTTQFELNLTLVANARGLFASWQFSTDLLDRVRIEGMAADYAWLLDRFVALPDARIEALGRELDGQRRLEAAQREEERKQQRSRQLSVVRRRAVEAVPA
ncbi:MAG TPA: amino acid adenylation domain-containing protein [Thermoanaerobaculia bacterium]|nr:amino acid adenylation domain-containing protein [Thermoanaerobaculia bacterium]